jgi:hypothetical protein
MFNIVDDSDSTQDKLARAVADVWGIDFGFLNATIATLVQQFAKASPDLSLSLTCADRLHRDG